jgi:hypothetical protein
VRSQLPRPPTGAPELPDIRPRRAVLRTLRVNHLRRTLSDAEKRQQTAGRIRYRQPLIESPTAADRTDRGSTAAAKPRDTSAAQAYDPRCAWLTLTSPQV